MSVVNPIASVEPVPPSPQPFYVQAVIVCSGYADILAHTLPLNLREIDRIVVVTEPEDKQTQQVCAYYGVQVELTDTIATRWGLFCKGAGINAGLRKLERRDWWLHLDADVILPPGFHNILERAQLDPTMIYGCDRAEFRSFAEWQSFHQAPEPQTQGNGFFIHVANTGRPLGTRVAFQHHGGYIPIGFFQLWNVASGVFEYPAGHTDAGREDSHFPTAWPRSKRALIPEIVVYHLESEKGEMGINWKGRKSKKFGMWEDA